MAAAQALVFASGDLNDGIAVRAAIKQANFVAAADGGADLALQLSCRVDLLVGDMDSVQPQTIEHLRQNGTEILCYPPEKNETDLELALTEVARRGATWIRIIGGLGGRLDQMLANIYLMNLPILQKIDVRLVAGNQTTWLLQPGLHPMMGNHGDTLSLIPIAGDIQRITTTDLKYPLHDEILRFGMARGISNVINGENPTVQFSDGLLLVVHTTGRA